MGVTIARDTTDEKLYICMCICVCNSVWEMLALQMSRERENVSLQIVYDLKVGLRNSGDWA